MSLFDKFVNKVKNINENITDQESIYDQIVERQYQVQQQDLSKLSSQQLADIVNKYDDFVNQYIAKAKQQEIMNSELQNQIEMAENQRKEMQDENEQLTIQVQEIQKHFNTEMTKSIELQQQIDLTMKQNTLLKEKIQNQTVAPSQSKKSFGGSQLAEDFEPQGQIVMDPDSKLLLFTDEKELQEIRNRFELIQQDSNAIIEKLKSENKENTDQYKENKENGEEDEEEEYTLEDLCMNCWDSLASFNEYFDVFKNKLDKVGQEKDTISQQNKDKISAQEKEIQELKDQLIENQKLQKTSNQNQSQMEEDFVNLSKSVAQEKELNAHLQDKITDLLKSIKEKEDEIEQVKETMQHMIEEKNSLREEMLKMSEMITETEQKCEKKIKDIQDRQQMNDKDKDSAYQQDIENLNQDYQDLENDFNDLDEQFKKQETKLKDAENKIIQEQLKTKQAEKNLSKLDEKYQKTKKDLEELISQNDRNRERIVKLEEKRVDDKKKMKEQKKKIIEFQESKSFVDKSKMLDLEAKTEQIVTLQERVRHYEEKINVKEEVQKQTLEKDMKINNLELQLESNKTEIFQIQSLNTKLQNEKQRLELGSRQKETQIKQLQEKRELALAEIKRLSCQLEMIKNLQNPQQQQKIQYIENLIEKADKMNQSFSSEQNYNGGNIVVDSSPSLPEQIQGNYQMHKPKTTNNSRRNSGNNDILKDLHQQIGQQNTDIQLKELKCLQMIMGDLQKLYKEYIMVAFSIKDNKQLLKFEKRFNDSIKKAQDLMDTLEDQLD